MQTIHMTVLRTNKLQLYLTLFLLVYILQGRISQLHKIFNVCYLYGFIFTSSN